MDIENPAGAAWTRAVDRGQTARRAAAGAGRSRVCPAQFFEVDRLRAEQPRVGLRQIERVDEERGGLAAFDKAAHIHREVHRIADHPGRESHRDRVQPAPADVVDAVARGLVAVPKPGGIAEQIERATGAGRLHRQHDFAGR